MSLSRTQIVNWLTRCGDIFSTESEYLTGLDREIGDADHGLNMNRGFSKVVEKLPAIADKDIGFILKNTGMTLLSSVGGASGPLFGTFFIRAAQATQARQSLTLEELYQMFRDGADGVISRGKAEPGDKTMCDVWVRWWNRYVSPASKISLFRRRSKLPVASPSPLHKVRLRCKPAKAAPVISVNAVLVTRTPVRPR